MSGLAPAPFIGHPPLPMRYGGRTSIRSMGEAGDYFFEQGGDGQIIGLIVALPRVGWPSNRRWLPVKFYFAPAAHPADGAQWTWDGSIEQPTVAESLFYPGVWHGHITAGYLIEEGASG